MYTRVIPVASEIHDQRAQWRQTRTARDHQHVATATIDVHAAVWAGQPPPVAGLGLADDRGADHAAGDRTDVKFDGPAAVGRDRRAQVAPPPRPLRDLDRDVLAGVVVQRLIELQP